jgi:hypothetical protein
MFKHRTMFLLTGVSMLALFACDRTTPATRSGAQATEPSNVTNTNAVVPADPLASVENRDKLKTYADEIKFPQPRTAQLITGFASEVRESPMGESIATIKTTIPVRELARDKTGNYFLVTYPDPANPSKNLAGWVYKDALENTDWAAAGANGAAGGAPSTPPTKLDCSKVKQGDEHLRTDHEFCGQPCTDDTACDKSAGERCDGHAFDVNEKTNTMTSVKYCVSG